MEKQQRRQESFGGEEAAMAAAAAAGSTWTSWSLVQSCAGYLSRLSDYFVGAPAALPPPQEVAGAAGGDSGSGAVHVETRSSDFVRNKNHNRGSGGNGGIKY